jgi:hypothetical protein
MKEVLFIPTIVFLIFLTYVIGDFIMDKGNNFWGIFVWIIGGGTSLFLTFRKIYKNTRK